MIERGYFTMTGGGGSVVPHVLFRQCTWSRLLGKQWVDTNSSQNSKAASSLSGVANGGRTTSLMN